MNIVEAVQLKVGGKCDEMIFTLKGDYGAKPERRQVRLVLSGDCCSQSFFEKNSIEDARGLVGLNLRAIEHVSSGIPDRKDARFDVTVYHAVKITTEDRVVVIDWRNESNGYYDGECEVIGWEVKP